jgi:hypothetical protein
MDIRIIAQKRGAPAYEEVWSDRLLDAARDHARTLVENGLADRVEIRDSEDKLLFQYPRTLRSAFALKP